MSSSGGHWSPFIDATAFLVISDAFASIWPIARAIASPRTSASAGLGGSSEAGPLSTTVGEAGAAPAGRLDVGDRRLLLLELLREELPLAGLEVLLGELGLEGRDRVQHGARHVVARVQPRVRRRCADRLELLVLELLRAGFLEGFEGRVGRGGGVSLGGSAASGSSPGLTS
jgi:hypothetical protein